jgi:hypothetical protein
VSQRQEEGCNDDGRCERISLHLSLEIDLGQNPVEHLEAAEQQHDAHETKNKRTKHADPKVLRQIQHLNSPECTVWTEGLETLFFTKRLYLDFVGL